MKLDWHPKSVDEFLSLEPDIQKVIKVEIDKLPEKGLNCDKVEIIEREEIDFTCYRLKIDPDNRETINYRVLFKMKKEEYLILKIGRRPDFYDLDNLEEAQKRLN